jgi:hypothetical protein
VAVRDVADREVRGRAYGLVGDGDLVMLLIALADTQEDLDGLLERRFLDHHRLEPRSRAASRSMYLRYSSSVVAPMHCSSPRASGGLRMFARRSHLRRLRLRRGYAARR